MAGIKSQKQYEKMTETPVAKLVVSLGIPTTIIMMITMLYNMVDTAFVGTLGTSASGATGIVFGYMAVLQATGFLFGHGAGAIVSRLLGEKRPDDASRIASTGFAAAFLMGLLVSILTLLFMNPLLRLLGSTETILPYARSYCRFIALGAPSIMGAFVLNNLLRYEGLATKAMIGMVTGGILNIGLDALFIFGLHMGTGGAGLATALSQMCSFFILLYMFLSGQAQCRLSVRNISRRAHDLLEIISVGFPSLVRQALGSLSTIVLNNLAGHYGDAAIAGMAICGRVVMFLFAFCLGMGQGYQPVCSFNYGAKKYQRVRDAYKTIIAITTVLLAALAAAAFAFAPQIVRVFRNDPEVIAIGGQALRYACLVMIVLPFNTATNMTLQSSGKSLHASITSAMRNGLFFLPVLLILSNLIGLRGIQMAQPISDVLTFLATIPFGVHYFRTLPKESTLQEA